MKKETENPVDSRSREAYQRALRDLQHLNNRHGHHLLRTLYADRRFNYGEEGYGLVLPGGLAYISSESAEDIRAYDGEIKIKENGWLEWDCVEWRWIDGKIPQHAIEEVTRFAKQVREQCEALQVAPASTLEGI